MGKSSRTKKREREAGVAAPLIDAPPPSAAAQPAPRSDDRALLFGVPLFLIIALIAIYSGITSHAFINYDDPIYVGANPHVQGGLSATAIRWAFTTFHAELWQPLTWLSLMTDVQLFGAIAGRMLIVNVLLHTASAILLFFLLRRLTSSPWKCAIVAALFAVHPQRVESVAWVTERKDVLSTLLFLATLWCWTSFLRKRTTARYLAALAGFALALMAKSMVVTLPFVLLLLDYWPLERFSWRELNRLPRLVLEKLPFFLLIVPASIVTIVAQSPALASRERVSLSIRCANALVSYASYLGRMIVPVRLSIVYPYHTVAILQAIAAALLLMTITASALFAGREKRYLAVGWLWFIGTLVPVIGIVQAGQQAMADRFTYIPSIGILIAVVWLAGELVARNETRQRAAVAIAFVLTVTYAVVAHIQNGYWKDSRAIFQHAVDVTSHNALASNNLAAALMENKEYAKARAQYTTALQLSPGNVVSLYGLGLVMRTDGRLAEAAGYFRQVLAAEPTRNDVLLSLGEAELASGNQQAALEALRAAVAAAPEDPKARGALLLAQNDPQSAIKAYEHAASADRGNADLQNNLAAALAKSGRNREALDHYLAALQIDPDHYDGHMNVGALLSREGRAAEALTHFSAAASLRPASAEPLVYLALLHANLGSTAAAASGIERAIQIDEKTANATLTSAVHMPFKETNARDYLAFLQSRR